jgi:hypothetical protein
VLPELTEEFRSQYARLLTVRPGLTDPASLKYSQEARLLGTVTDPMGFFKSVVTPDKIAISLRYVEHANLWTDGLTLAMTALICCFPSLGSVSQAVLDSGEGRGFVWNPDAEFRLRMNGLQAREGEGSRRKVLLFPDRRSKGRGSVLPWNPAFVVPKEEVSTPRRSRQSGSLL